MLLDSLQLWPSFAMLVSLLLLGAFDFYAYSPRPSGVAMRSRELAPALIIFLSLSAAFLSLRMQSATDVDSLIGHGASFAPRALGSDRIRLLTYPLVITSPFESVLIALALVTSSIFVGSIGMLGWSIVVIGITLGTGLLATLIEPNGVMHGPFEVSCGLFFASFFYFLSLHRKAIQRTFKYLGDRKLRIALDRFAPVIIPSCILISQLIGVLILGSIQRTPLNYEVLIASVWVSAGISVWFWFVKRFTGPHWESTSLFFVSAIGGFVVAGLFVYLAPRGFDHPQWRTEGTTLRSQIREDLVAAMTPLEENGKIVPELESTFADRLRISVQRISRYNSRAELRDELTTDDISAISEIKLVGRMLGILERLHRSRAAIADADRKTNAGSMQVDGFIQSDALQKFWQEDRPWMDSELYSLGLSNESPGEAAPKQQSLKTFLRALNADLERLTQAALDVEIRRVDAWVDWATRQPSSLLPSMKIIAVEQVAKLDSLSTRARAMRLQPDPRIYTLHRNLRRMASVSSPDKWE